GLVGSVPPAAARPSTGFALFGGLSVVAVALFVLNLGATMRLAPAEAEEEEDAPSASPQAPTPPPVDIHPDMRMGEILTRWPGTVEVFVANGFASLWKPER